MKQLITFSIFSFLLVNTTKSQDACKVAVDALQGTYTGGCKDGKADGQGSAVGTDAYTGQFKNGYPEGEGTYTWANKDAYKGNFKKGNMEGKGEMTYSTKTGIDSIVKGFWKKNKYVGAYEKPFIINDRSGKVNKVDVMIVRKGDKSGSINVNSSQLQSVSNFNASPLIPVINDVQVVTGQYISKTISTISKNTVLRLQQMIFPFRARFLYSNGEVVDITFNEQADYEVTISLL
ncbi:MAG: hypothetical protein EOP47_24525 [Sphingobacteriaceae bacterium]|nr:MAG: hypothetical protein EOP47_24525 [Sphingobacteriaceae bacterium]